MATAVQRRRGSTLEHLSFTGVEGEVTIDSSKKTAVIHDGSTAGGISLLRQDASNYDGSEINNFRSQGIDDNVTDHTPQLILSNSGLLVGSPTGGTQGTGTINVEGIFVNGSSVLNASDDVVVTANWRFTGNVNFTGSVVTVNSTNVNVSDNSVILNSGEIGNGVSAGTSGVEIHRGFSDSFVATTGNLTFAEGNPDTIKRQTGYWPTDGVVVGSYVSIQGSSHNDGVYLVAGFQTIDNPDDTIVLDIKEDLVPDGPEAVGTVTILNNPNPRAMFFYDDSDGSWNLGLEGSELALGTAAYVDTGTGATDVPLNSNLNAANWDTAHGWGDHGSAGYELVTNLGTAAYVNTGTGATDVPLNSDLGTAAYEAVATGGTGDLLRSDGDGSALTGMLEIGDVLPFAVIGW